MDNNANLPVAQHQLEGRWHRRCAHCRAGSICAPILFPHFATTKNPQWNFQAWVALGRRKLRGELCTVRTTFRLPPPETRILLKHCCGREPHPLGPGINRPTESAQRSLHQRSHLMRSLLIAGHQKYGQNRSRRSLCVAHRPLRLTKSATHVREHQLRT